MTLLDNVSILLVPADRQPLMPRIRHRLLNIFLLGGAIGSGMNVGVTMLLAGMFGLNPFIAFFVGMMTNQLFHYVYYHVVFVNQEIRMRMSFGLQLALYALVATAALAPMGLLMHLSLPLASAVIATIGMLSVANVVCVRMSSFSSSKMAEIEYKDIGESFYDDQTDAKKVGWFRAWFHSTRHTLLHDFVAKHYQPGMTIADLGCGNCWWNNDSLPVTGVDVNEKMMNWAKRHNRLADYRIAADLAKTGLADQSFDLVVMSETLEHIFNLDEVITEVRRILKPGGKFLITVPYDLFLGPFFILFNINCLWQGYVKGSIYHRYRCGHINHFTKTRLRDALEANGFGVESITVPNKLTLYAVAKPK